MFNKFLRWCNTLWMLVFYFILFLHSWYLNIWSTVWVIKGIFRLKHRLWHETSFGSFIHFSNIFRRLLCLLLCWWFPRILPYVYVFLRGILATWFRKISYLYNAWFVVFRRFSRLIYFANFVSFEPTRIFMTLRNDLLLATIFLEITSAFKTWNFGEIGWLDYYI